MKPGKLQRNKTNHSAPPPPPKKKKPEANEQKQNSCYEV